MCAAKPSFSLTDFDYHLPPELIAHAAAEPRESARLLAWPDTSEHTVADLPDLLTPGDLLVLNDSRVIPARLYGTRAGRDGGPNINIELLLHKATKPDLTEWQVFAKPGRRLKVGDDILLEGGAFATVQSTGANPVIRFNLPASQVPSYLEKHGHTPLPPYIHTEDTAQIRERYQTTYADPTKPGSVAAPTAGLHFTPQLIEKLAAKGIQTTKVTLHVGAGTFLNPTPEQLAEKRLHAEVATLPESAARAIAETKRAGGNVIPVGTTALRTIESWARLGEAHPFGWSGETTLFIQPGDDFQVADKLLTNFHLPQSSLLMLVSAFIGVEEARRLYAHAIENNYRFYSFGDASLLTRKKT